jgi:hypothetical protein
MPATKPKKLPEMAPARAGEPCPDHGQEAMVSICMACRGALGGSRTSVAKTAAARAAIKTRWSRRKPKSPR